MQSSTLIRSAIATLALAVSAFALPQSAPPADAPKTDAPKAAARVTDHWPLDICIVSGQKLDSGSVTEIYTDASDKANNGREMKFCCKDCAAKFKKDPKKFLVKANEAIIAKESASYPMTTCVVMGEKLDADAKVVVVGNRMFKICCGKCEASIIKNFDKYCSKVDEAAKVGKSAK